jgi:hypothetical protein
MILSYNDNSYKIKTEPIKNIENNTVLIHVNPLTTFSIFSELVGVELFEV